MATCSADGNDYNGQLGTRISSIFVIMVGSWAGKSCAAPCIIQQQKTNVVSGAWFPVFARRHRALGVPEWTFFIAKYFGSGVIIATAFIHVRGSWEQVEP